jgi:hypothetical protein
MLLDSFAFLAKADSGFTETYRQLEAFTRKHSDWKWLDPVIVSKDLPLLDAFDLGAALTEAVELGVLRIKYTVLTPDGVAAAEAFDSPSKIPISLPDRFEQFFDTRVQPLVTVFEEDSKSETANRVEAIAAEGANAEAGKQTNSEDDEVDDNHTLEQGAE